MNEKLVNILKKINIPLVLLLIMLPLRLINLGYSEYICDESVALDYLRVNGSFYTPEFLLSQHKGPLQYVIGGLVFLLTKDVFNEYVYRIPFALGNVASIIILYLFVKNITKSKLAGFISAFLFGINNLIVVFGRIYQYQSFNILFSFLSMYFYSNIHISENSPKNINKNSILGTIFFCTSLLFHWDAVFILPYVLFVVFKKVLLNKGLDKKVKLNFIFFNTLVLALLMVFYLIPYTRYFLNSRENQDYFRNRIDPGVITIKDIWGRVKFMFFRIKLYNPFLYMGIYILGIISSFPIFKNIWPYLLWFFGEFLIFIFVFTNPGTHIYNIFIPLSILVGIVFTHYFNLYHKNEKFMKIISLLIFLSFSFLFYQSYYLFIHHYPEYPWRTKKVLFLKTGDFSEEERTKYMRNNKIGFPLRREWLKVEEILSNYEIENEISVGSTKVQTNENYCPPVFYTGRKLSDHGDRFIVAVKYPLSLVNDYKGFAKNTKKELIDKIYDKKENSIVYIYVSMKGNQEE